MPKYAESNACSACATSKRKCGRQVPSCARCADRGKSCIYPSSKSKVASSSRPLLSNTSRGSVPGVEDGLLAETTGNTSSRHANPIGVADLMLDQAFPFIDNDLSTPSSFTQTRSAPATRTDWFLTPETWTISYNTETSETVGASNPTMKKYLELLRSWFQRWISTGSNPFIHPHLYSANFPMCMQVAFATLTSYTHRTPANTDTILQIVEDRSNELLQENGAVMESVDTEKWADKGEDDVDLFAQLTRLHALMVYQIIGLFDGDIRSRHVAEGHMAVQNIWANKLFLSAGKALSNTYTRSTHLVGSLPKASTYTQQQWYLWILSESIRRTWLVAASMSPIYSAIQKRWAPCPGGVMFTNRGGLWNAPTATEWEKQCLGRNVAFMQRFDCSRLFDNTDAEDMDEFSLAMMDLTFNGELLERWRNRSFYGANMDGIYAMG